MRPQVILRSSSRWKSRTLAETKHPITRLYFDVQDSTGAVYAAFALAPEPDLPAGTLGRGEKVRGNVAFVVPQSSAGFRVMYEPLVIFGGYQTISVRLGD